VQFIKSFPTPVMRATSKIPPVSTHSSEISYAPTIWCPGHRV